MNFRDTYLICKKNLKAVGSLHREEYTQNPQMGRKASRVSGWLPVMDALQQIAKIGAFKQYANAYLESVPSIYRNKDKFEVDNSEWNAIENAAGVLKRKMQTVIELYEGMELAETDGITLNVKLPAYRDFQEFAQYINELEFVLQQCPFLHAEQEQLKFHNVDVGSTWLTFFVAGSGVLAGSVILNNLAAFVDKCIIIRSHYLTTEKQKEELQSYTRGQEKKEAILEYIEEGYKAAMEEAINELQQVTECELKDGEDRERARKSIEKMGQLFDKGLQICTAVDAPQEIQALFAPLEMKYLEVGQMKYLKDPDEEDEA